MRILFISEDLIGGNVALRLHSEGHEIKLFIAEEGRRENFNNIIPKTQNWHEELDWVGKDGVIVFDYVGEGDTQDELRKQGYSVFGGGSKGEKLEENRQFTDDVFSRLNFQRTPIIDFESLDDAIVYVKRNPNRYVIKKNDTSTNSVTYVGMLSDGRDVIDVLNNYKHFNQEDGRRISLQPHVKGIEIAVARFFNGNEWVSPIELNIEHNPFMSGEIGISTSEMGTIGWYTDNEQNEIYKRTLGKLENYLREIDYRGAIDINCIVNADGIFPLEVTARFGSPIAHLQTEMLQSGWGELIYACAHGKKYMARFRKGYGIVIFVTTPPFPYSKHLDTINPYGQTIYFINSETIPEYIHFEDVAYDLINNKYYISDTRGYILYVTASAASMEEAQTIAYERISSVVFPKMTYRNDIGTNFINEGRNQLSEWGYL